MTIGIQSAARRLCARSNWTLTNLQLQKILYISQMLHLGSNNARLINADFEAWDFGPVEPDLYHMVKIFGDRPIQDIFFGAKEIDSTRAEARHLDQFYDILGKWTPAKLVSFTHWNNGAWAKAYVPGVKGIQISDEEIINEYRARATRLKPAAG